MNILNSLKFGELKNGANLYRELFDTQSNIVDG